MTEKELVTFDVEGGKVTEGGIRTNVSIALQYLNQWFKVKELSLIDNFENGFLLCMHFYRINLLVQY